MVVQCCDVLFLEEVSIVMLDEIISFVNCEWHKEHPDWINCSFPQRCLVNSEGISECRTYEPCQGLFTSATGVWWAQDTSGSGETHNQTPSLEKIKQRYVFITYIN